MNKNESENIITYLTVFVKVGFVLIVVRNILFFANSVVRASARTHFRSRAAVRLWRNHAGGAAMSCSKHIIALIIKRYLTKTGLKLYNETQVFYHSSADFFPPLAIPWGKGGEAVNSPYLGEYKENMVKLPELGEMLKAGVHFGHQTSRWHPKMQPFLFGSRNGVHVIDLEKTQEKLAASLEYIKSLASQGKVVLFVGTKRQAAPLIKEAAMS